ncbi:uncharacterized protein METZ01_LOCUS157681, partial [marine metagenome]
LGPGRNCRLGSRSASASSRCPQQTCLRITLTTFFAGSSASPPGPAQTPSRS